MSTKVVLSLLVERASGGLRPFWWPGTQRLFVSVHETGRLLVAHGVDLDVLKEQPDEAVVFEATLAPQRLADLGAAVMETMTFARPRTTELSRVLRIVSADANATTRGKKANAGPLDEDADASPLDEDADASTQPARKDEAGGAGWSETSSADPTRAEIVVVPSPTPPGDGGGTRMAALELARAFRAATGSGGEAGADNADDEEGPDSEDDEQDADREDPVTAPPPSVGP